MEKRTAAQNNYLHTVFELVKDGLRNAGYDEVRTKEDAKIVCKQLFKVEKTSELSTKELAEFIQSIQRWASDYLGIYIPDPKQEDYFSAAGSDNERKTIA